jgi:tetratricopeptide (TPR) repeat protein
VSQPRSGSAGDRIVIDTADPRLRIMVSSTTVDLPEHRREAADAIQRLGHTAVVMEHGSAEWQSDAIKFSLERVEQSQVYVGVFALRYGHVPEDPVRNPQRLSVTELEYRHAVRLGIPTLIFLADENHPFTRKQIDFDEEKCAKLERLRAELQSSGICAFFDSPEKLREEVIVSLQRLQVRLTQPSPAAAAPREAPRPPELYAVPSYVLTDRFIGRSSELDRLDAWARSSDAVMVVEGIGGLGKSAVTWEWMNTRAPAVIPDLAGRVWWSFYEKGTSMVTFVRHALAYVTGQDPEALREGWSHHQRGQRLLTELRRRPFLLVLDGFERVLTAYHRLDKAQVRDDLVAGALRECVNPRDGELLMQLLRCSPSKVLISTRLFPSGLEDRGSRRPALGVARHRLDGLSPPDALTLMRHAGLAGDERAMLAFAEQFGRHSLLLKIVCGMVADYRRRPYDFDAWRADPNHGGGLRLSEVALTQRYTHVLHFALAGLGETVRRLLCRIAVVSESASYDMLALINPFRPEPVYQPEHPSSWMWSWDRMSDEEKQQRQAAYLEELAAYRLYQDAVRRASLAFDAALKELENRGLLQWDRASDRYDMHPVVRGYAAELLEAGDRTETFNKVLDHFASLPPDDLEAATELAHVAHSLELYRCEVGAELLDHAAHFLRDGLAFTLYAHVGAHAVLLELLKPLFQDDLKGMPCLYAPSDRAYVLNCLASAYSGLGRWSEVPAVLANKLRLDAEAWRWGEAATALRNLRLALDRLDRRADAAAALSLARELSEAIGDEDGVTMAIFGQACDAVVQGRLDDAAALEEEFGKRQPPPITACRPGDAECWRCWRLFRRGELTEAEWQAGYDLAVRSRNVHGQQQFLALHAEWDLSEGRPQRALDCIDQALQITNRLGIPSPHCRDLRAWALALLGRPTDASAELHEGERRLAAAEAHLVLGDPDGARACALDAYRWAWGEGPPHVLRHELQRSRDLLLLLGEPEPQLPPFDPSSVPPVPFEGVFRATIGRFRGWTGRRQGSGTRDSVQSG